MIRIYFTKDVDKLIEAIQTLNLKRESTILSSRSNNFISRHKFPVSGYIVKKEKKVIGWGADFNDEFHLYISRKYRNRGIGTRMVQRALKDFPNSKFCPWNDITSRFFRRLPIENIAPNYLYRYTPE